MPQKRIDATGENEYDELIDIIDNTSNILNTTIINTSNELNSNIVNISNSLNSNIVKSRYQNWTS